MKRQKKMDKPLARLIKKKERGPKPIKSQTTDTTDVR